MTDVAPKNLTPDVSVLIPAWKAGAFVGAAIESALQSTGLSVEVVVVDDASPDNTFEVLKTLAARDPRVKIDRLSSNGGPSAARNRAIELASGRYLAVLDADDTMTPDRLARLASIADRGSFDIVVDNMLEVDEDGAPIGDGVFLADNEFLHPRTITLQDWAWYNRAMKGEVCIGYLKPLIRRSTLDRLKVRYDTHLRNSEDYYLVANLLALGARMHYDPQPGYRYRRSATSTSSRLLPRDTAAWIDAEQRFVAQHAANLSQEEMRLLRLRAADLKDLDQWANAYDAIKTKRFGRLTRILASSPGSSAFTLGWFARAGLSKLHKAMRPAS